MTAVWAGIDSGKRTHYCVVIDAAESVSLSRKVVNHDAALLDLIAAITGVADADEVCGPPTSTPVERRCSLLAGHGQQVLYIPGRIVHHAAATYRGDGKTDAKDARIIANRALMRTDLQPVRLSDSQHRSLTVDFPPHRPELRPGPAINRLRATMPEYCPALEATFDCSKKAPLMLLSGYQTPAPSARSEPQNWLRG